MVKKLKSSPRRTAKHDITEWIKEQNIRVTDSHNDVWVMTSYRMDNPEQRKLNKELGITKVNYTKDNMSRVIKINKMEEKLINLIRVERARHKLTQGDLAQNIGCSRQTIHSIENDKFEPSTKLSLKIIRYLNELKEAAGMELITIEDVFKLEKL